MFVCVFAPRNKYVCLCVCLLQGTSTYVFVYVCSKEQVCLCICLIQSCVQGTSMFVCMFVCMFDPKLCASLLQGANNMCIMFVCRLVCMFVRTYVCTCVCVCVCVYMYIRVCMYIQSYVRMCMYSAHSKPLKMFGHTFKRIKPTYIAASNLVGQREKLTGQMPNYKLAGKCPVTDCYYEQCTDVYLCTYRCTDVHTDVYTYVQMCMYVHTYVCTNTCASCASPTLTNLLSVGACECSVIGHTSGSYKDITDHILNLFVIVLQGIQEGRYCV